MPNRLSPPDAARRRYLVVHIVLMIAFTGSMFAVVGVGPTTHPIVRGLLVLLPAVLLALSVLEFARMVRNSDEMMKPLYLTAVSISATLVLVAGTVWGLLEVLLDTPRFPAFLLLPAFALLYGIVLPLLSRRR